MKKLILAMSAASVAIMPGAAMAQRYNGDWNRVRAYDYNNPEPGHSPYYADRYYRPGPEYVMSRGDRIYRGRDGRFYCRRRDGSTGLVVGAAIGAVVGNSLRLGGSSTLGTILGGAAGAALGSSVDSHRLRCR
ncbi:MAG TPA: glycine zipper 2TM domain-containing protein [Sphingomicrobium sp.]|nr:glycine zipper 2TM domain-containing protein [Sphingomicrobium sp.]